MENKAKARKQAEHRMQQQVNQAKQRLEKRKAREDAPQVDEEPKKKKSRGAKQRERKRLEREEGKNVDADARLASLKAEKDRLREAKAAEKAKSQQLKPVKPPKKKKRIDKEEENFDSIVDTYRSTFVDSSSSSPMTNPREGVKKKRWFE